MNILELYNMINLTKNECYQLGDRKDYIFYNINNVYAFCENNIIPDKIIVDRNSPVIIRTPYPKCCFAAKNIFIFSQEWKTDDLYKNFPKAFYKEYNSENYGPNSILLIVYVYEDNYKEGFYKKPIIYSYGIITLTEEYKFYSIYSGLTMDHIEAQLKLAYSRGKQKGIDQCNENFDKSMDDIHAFNDQFNTLFLETILLLNCKNIIVEDNKERVRKSTKKSVGQSAYKNIEYKQLCIEVPGISHKYNKNNIILSSKKLHMVSGHPAYYTKEKPLFGKYSGLVWVSAHMRGNKNKGEIKKSYKIKNIKAEK